MCLDGLVEKPQPLECKQESAHRDEHANVNLVVEPLDHDLRNHSKRATITCAVGGSSTDAQGGACSERRTFRFDLTYLCGRRLARHARRHAR
jgi:hypothetical protein